MLKEVLVLTSAFIVATSNSPAVASGDAGPPPLPPAQPGKDYNDVGSPPLKNTDSLMVSEEEIDFNYGNFSTRRKGCSPTISCTLAGGHCVKSGSGCDGTLDKKGCTGGKKCKCCIPDRTLSSPPTCPAAPTCPAPATCPEASTCPPPITCPDCPTTPMLTTVEPTTPVLTTVEPTPPVTTPAVAGSTLPPNVPWHVVGSDRFVRFPQEMSWVAARSLCQSFDLDVYEPRNITAVAVYLDDNFSDKWYWLGARGNGTHQVWLSGKVLTRADPWYSDYWRRVSSSECVLIITHSGYAAREISLVAIGCTTTNKDVICG